MDNASDQMPPDTNLRDAISQLGAQLRRTRGGKAQIPVVVGDTEPALVELAELINNILDDARSNVGRLEDANRDLDSMVRQRTAELEHAKTVAELGSTAKSKFLAQMSHELRTPLNSIIGFAQLLLDSNKEILSDRQRKQVKYILRGGRHLLGLINDVLDLSKI